MTPISRGFGGRRRAAESLAAQRTHRRAITGVPRVTALAHAADAPSANPETATSAQRGASYPLCPGMRASRSRLI